MSRKTAIWATAIWTVIALGLCVIGLVYIGTRPISNRAKEERARLFGQGAGTVTAIGYGVIWLPYAYRVGKQRREEEVRAEKKGKKGRRE